MDIGKPEDRWLQERYARWLDACSRAAFAVSLVTFLAYAGGLLDPFVARERLPELWHLSLAE